MYVAVTRAEKALFLTESEGFCNAIKGAKYPSRFLTEIGDGLIEVKGDMDPTLLEITKDMVRRFDNETAAPDKGRFAVGDTVRHKLFGEGKVVEAFADRDAYRIDFGSRGTRNLVGRVLEKKD